MSVSRTRVPFINASRRQARDAGSGAAACRTSRRDPRAVVTKSNGPAPAALAPRPLARPDPLGPACRLAAAALADALGAVDRRRRLPGLAPAGGVRRRNDPDAQRRLRRQRRRRSRVRPPRQAHRRAAGDQRRGPASGKRSRSAPCSRCVAFALVLTTNAAAVAWSFVALAVTLFYPFSKRFFAMPQAVLGVAFSFGIPMAFAAVRGGEARSLADMLRRGAAARLVAAARQPVLGARLRHRVRHGRPRRRPAHRHQDLGDHARPLRRASP